MALLGSQFGGGLTLGLGRQLQTDRNIAGAVGVIAQQTAANATNGVGQGLAAQLGQAGDGPLGQSISATGSLAARTATRAVLTEFSGCTNADDRSCVDARLGALGKAVGDGVAAGTLRALRFPLLVLAFVAGIVVALIVVWAVIVARRRPVAT